MTKKALLTLAASAALLLASATVEAKPARCYVSDEGHYPCEFRFSGNDGSFIITAAGKPAYSLVIDRPGVGLGFIDVGSGGRALPGKFIRSDNQPACWVSDETGAKICAW